MGTGQGNIPNKNRPCPYPFFLVNPHFKQSVNLFKIVQGFNPAVFHPLFFRSIWPLKHVQENFWTQNLSLFERERNVFYQNPFNSIP